MKTGKTIKLNKVTHVLIIVACLLYIFTFQMNYPMEAEVFLYITASLLVAQMFLLGRVSIVLQTLLFGLVAFVSFLGLFYSEMLEEGLRESLLFCLFFFVFLLSRGSLNMVKRFVKWVYIISVLVTVTVIIHSLVPEQFNEFAEGILRKDCYDQLMWSYTVDNAYAGVSAYTANAALFAAIAMGQSFLNLYPKYGTPVIKNKLVNILFVIIGVYAVILCSKRGVFLAVIGGVIVLLASIYRKRSFFLRMVGVIAACSLLMIILYKTNETVATFLDRFIKTENFYTGRDEIFRKILDSFFDGNVFVGYGTGATYKIYASGAHNIYLELLYDHGVIFSLPFFALFAVNYYKAAKNKARMSLFVQSVFLIYGFSGNPLYTNMFMLIYVFYTLYASYPEEVRNEGGNLNLPQRRELRRGFAGIRFTANRRKSWNKL